MNGFSPSAEASGDENSYHLGNHLAFQVKTIDETQRSSENNASVAADGLQHPSPHRHPHQGSQDFEKWWGFDSLEEVYRLAVTFQKEKEGKALHLSYAEKLQLVARFQQINHGPFDPNATPTVGYLDVIGRDRRQAWQTLGSMSKEEAMGQFVEILDKACALFGPYVEAHKRDIEERERVRKEAEERLRKEELEKEQRKLEDETRRKEQQEQRRMEMQKQQIQDALNQQTYFQFKSYAEQQFPGNPEQQAVLIRQLQEQHYQQYMQQVYQQQQQKEQQQQQETQLVATSTNQHHHPSDDDEDEQSEDDDEEDGSGEELRRPNELPSLVKPASMWTRKDLSEFKASIEKEGGDAIIRVGHGETVTVRVPTHEEGTCLFWEFATDHYDIGFGVYFEWTKHAEQHVSVHVSESDEDEEDDDEDEDGGQRRGERDEEEFGFVASQGGVGGDVERGVSRGKDGCRPPMAVVIPVYRRDCHEEVYAGSHTYPGQGVYLLKFDNSYSLWRSKTLYYRVYYTH